MDYSSLDIECYTNRIRQDLPELFDCVETFGLFDVIDMMRITGYIPPWKDLASSIESAVDWVKNDVDVSEGRRGVALCPAGGHAAEFLDAFKKHGINVKGFLDSHKSNGHSTYMGLPLYSLHEDSVQLFGKVLIVSQAYSNELFDAVIRYANGDSTAVFVPFVGDFIDYEFCGAHISIMNEICRKNRGQTVVYAVDRLYFHNVNRVKALSENGMKVILLTSEDLIHHSLALDSVSDIFEHICCTRHSTMDLLYILGRIYPDIIHVAPVVRHYETSVLMHAVSKAPVVCEFYDMLLSIHTRDEYRELFGRRAADIQFACEDYLCKRVEGIVYKSTDKEARRLMSHYSTDKPALQFQNYLQDHDCRKSPEWDGKRRLRIVYSGSVHACGIQDHGSSLLHIISDITGQNMTFDIFNVHDSGDPQFDAYRRASEDNPLFGYHMAVKNSDIVTHLSEYDFGWQVIDIKNSRQNLKHFETAMNAKFFDYISAGLPIVVSEEYRYMADLVREFDMGIVIRHEHIKHISKILGDVDVNELKRHVAACRNLWSMERNIHRLTAFYKSFMSPRPMPQAVFS